MHKSEQILCNPLKHDTFEIRLSGHSITHIRESCDLLRKETPMAQQTGTASNIACVLHTEQRLGTVDLIASQVQLSEIFLKQHCTLYFSHGMFTVCNIQMRQNLN